jgi:hypothetical protein
MAESPIASSAGPLRQPERSAEALLSPGGLTLRPFEAWTASPVRPALAVAVAFAAASIAGRILIGGQQPASLGGEFDWNYIWLDGLNGVIFAYIPAALVLLRRGIARDFTLLRPTLRCSDSELRELVDSATCVPLGRLATCGAIGVLAFALMPVYDPGFFEGERPPLSDPLLLFFVARGALTGWVVGLAAASEIGSAITYRNLGRDLVRVDLLDTRRLQPFARRGMRSALAWILCNSLLSLFWLGPGAGNVNGVILVSTIVLLGALLGFSISGVRDSIRCEKRRQLDALRERIRQQRRVVLGEAGSSPGEGAQLADLIAYHDLIERAPEWPFDAPMAARFALFALLGLGSWLGGALVERLLESWL